MTVGIAGIDNLLNLHVSMSGMIFAANIGHKGIQGLSIGDADDHPQSGGLLPALGAPVLSVQPNGNRRGRYPRGGRELPEIIVEETRRLASRSGRPGDQALPVS